MQPRRRQPTPTTRLVLGALIIVLCAAVAIGYSAEAGSRMGTVDAQAVAGNAPSQAAATAGKQSANSTAQSQSQATAPPNASSSSAQPRIPITSANRDESNATPVPVDPHCAQGCIVRVAASAVGSASVLWQQGDTAYVAATAQVFPTLQSPVVASASLDTLPLYVLYKVDPSEDPLIQKHGTIRDSVGDVRLLESKRVPLIVNDLYGAGIWVEKLQPFTAAGPGSRQQPIPKTIAEFSSINARDGVLGDREYDDQGTVMAAEYLFRRYSQLGFQVHYADFTGPDGSHQMNVVADPPKSNSPQPLMVTGHYDSISPGGQPAPGADDNASGIASMLEIAARNAQAGFSPAITFVSFAAEEPGLYGSDAYTQQLVAKGVKLKGVINLDAVGIDNKGIVYINGNSDSRAIYKDMVALSSDKYWLEWMSSNYFLSDDEHFRRVGYPAVMVTTHPWGTEPRHHTPQDRIEILDMGQINDLTDLVWTWLQKQTA